MMFKSSFCGYHLSYTVEMYNLAIENKKQGGRIATSPWKILHYLFPLIRYNY